jgi:chemotaxis protein MotB
MARRKEAHGGGHGWFVTFADLMGLLVSFFVMLVAFSNQDAKKVQAVAGSMRDAFGVQRDARWSGVVEIDGVLPRLTIKHAARIPPENSSVNPTPDQNSSNASTDRTLTLAAASLRQSWQDLPELTEASKHILVEEAKEGLNIELMDQDGQSMFPSGSKMPFERTREIIKRIASPLKSLPYRIAIVGHTAGQEPSRYGSKFDPWNLSSDRANQVRAILEEEGYPLQSISKVAGDGNAEPLFPEDPSLAPNRRVTITLIREAPAVPPNLRP